MNEEINELVLKAQRAINMGYWALAASKLRVAAMRCQDVANKLKHERLVTRNTLPTINFEELNNDEDK